MKMKTSKMIFLASSIRVKLIEFDESYFLLIIKVQWCFLITKKSSRHCTSSSRVNISNIFHLLLECAQSKWCSLFFASHFSLVFCCQKAIVCLKEKDAAVPSLYTLWATKSLPETKDVFVSALFVGCAQRFDTKTCLIISKTNFSLRARRRALK